MNLLFNLPLALTLIRLICSPLIIPLLFAYFLPHNLPSYNALVAIVFVVLSLTDFFDGYIARRYKQETMLGRLLDPIADKFLLSSALIALVYVHKLYFYWAIIFIGREIFIMGLREVALAYGISLQVTLSAKYKTAFQFAYIIMIILNPYQPLNQAINIIPAFMWYISEVILLIISLGFSLSSAFWYCKIFIKSLHERHI